MGLSQRQYAAHRGVSHTAVAKALATGRISAEPDGTIDPAKTDRQWDAATDPAKQRGAHARQLGAGTGRGTVAAKAPIGTKPVPRAAIEAVNKTLTEAGTETPPGDAEGGQVSFLRARMANEAIKAQTAKVRLQKMKGDLVDNRAVAAVFDLARRERDKRSLGEGHFSGHATGWSPRTRRWS